MRLVELVSEQSVINILVNNSNDTEEILNVTAIKLNDNDMTLLIKRRNEIILSIFIDDKCKFIDSIKCLIRKLAILKFYTHQIDIETNSYNLSIITNWNNTIVLKDSLENDYYNSNIKIGSKATIIAIRRGTHKYETVNQFDMVLDNDSNSITLSMYNKFKTIVLEEFNPFSICKYISEYLLSSGYIPRYFYIEVDSKLKSFIVLKDKANSLVILHT